MSLPSDYELLEGRDPVLIIFVFPGLSTTEYGTLKHLFIHSFIQPAMFTKHLTYVSPGTGVGDTTVSKT